jgi:hypothetical protein
MARSAARLPLAHCALPPKTLGFSFFSVSETSRAEKPDGLATIESAVGAGAPSAGTSVAEPTAVRHAAATV